MIAFFKPRKIVFAKTASFFVKSLGFGCSKNDRFFYFPISPEDSVRPKNGKLFRHANEEKYPNKPKEHPARHEAEEREKGEIAASCPISESETSNNCNPIIREYEKKTIFAALYTAELN
ncbi:hypothetical protein [Bacteroides heparinolyticus]|uniref:hypothetical protein n=1 Tax=Prevotella heparinolytica TaxID=28113 RepID=UPI00359F7164